MTIRDEGVESLFEYAAIPIRFTVRSRLSIPDLQEVPVDPWEKDYDDIPGEGPLTWPKSFDVTNWGVLVGRDAGRAVGGAVIGFDTPGLDMLEGRRDLAVVWDIRVVPAQRGHGIGRLLFAAAISWARERACAEIVVETQDINADACRFYQAMGCQMASVVPNAYPGLDETQILWRISI